jgi:hypothetical protein
MALIKISFQEAELNSEMGEIDSKHSSNIALAFIIQNNISSSDYSLVIVEIVNGAKNSTKQCSLRTNLWRGYII